MSNKPIVFVITALFIGFTSLNNASSSEGKPDERNVDLSNIQITNVGTEPISVYVLPHDALAPSYEINSGESENIDFSDSSTHLKMGVTCTPSIIPNWAHGTRVMRMDPFPITAQHINIRCDFPIVATPA